MARGAEGDEAEGPVPLQRCPGSSRAGLTFSQVEAGPSAPSLGQGPMRNSEPLLQLAAGPVLDRHLLCLQ